MEIAKIIRIWFGEIQPSLIGHPCRLENQSSNLILTTRELSKANTSCSNSASPVLSPLFGQLVIVNSNMGKKRKRQGNDDAGPQIRKRPHNGEAVPAGIFHYRKIEDVPWDTQLLATISHPVFTVPQTRIRLAEGKFSEEC